MIMNTDIAKSQLKKAFIAAYKYTIPVFTGFFILGIAYGVLMKTKGFGGIWPVLMSIVVFAGSTQFAAIPLFVSAFNPVQAFILALMINARHLFYGISLLKKYDGIGKVKPLLIFMLCDETFSIVSSTEPPEGVSKKYFYGWISVLDYSYWVLGTFLGSVFGGFIKFNTEGLDFALTALFVVLFIEQMKDKSTKIAGGMGLIVSLVCLCIFGADNVVLASMAAIIIMLILWRRKLEYTNDGGTTICK